MHKCIEFIRGQRFYDELVTVFFVCHFFFCGLINNKIHRCIRFHNMLKSVSVFSHLSHRFIFLFSVCTLICFVQIALIFQLFSSSIDDEKSFFSPLFSSFQTKLNCTQILQCPNNITHFSIHIDTYLNFTYIHSPIFSIILDTIRNSSYYTNDSSSACIHIAPVDTIDRDRRSKNGYYTYYIEQRLKFFNEWSDPNKIHLIYNHYTGSFSFF